MPSVVGLLEQRELVARRRVDELREEADRIQAELAVAERDWKEWAIARSRVGEVLAPADETGHGDDHADRTAPAADGQSVDYQRILTELTDRARLGQGPLTCQEMATLFGMDVVPARVEALRSKAKRLVARQATSAHQVGEETLDDPPLGQDHEAAHVVAAFDDRQDQGERGRTVLAEGSGVAAVGPDQLQLVVGVGDLAQEDLGGSAVADISARDHHAQQQAERVDHDVPLASVDLFAAVEAAAVGADERIRLDGLRVDHAGRRLRIPPQPLAEPGAQPIMELPDQGVVASAAEKRIHPVPRR